IVVDLGVSLGLLPGGLWHSPGRPNDTFGLVEIKEELQACSVFRQLAKAREQNLPQRIVLVIKRKLTGAEAVVRMLTVRVLGIEREHIARVRIGKANRQVTEVQETYRVAAGIIDRHVCVPQRLGAGDSIVPRTSVQEVAAKAAEDDVVRKRRTAGIIGELIVCRDPVRVETQRCDVNSLLEFTGDINGRKLNRTRRADRLLGCRSDVVERLRCSIAAGEEQAVVSKNAILPRTARDPVVAITADDIVILGVAEDYIAVRHAEDEIVPVFSID